MEPELWERSSRKEEAARMDWKSITLHKHAPFTSGSLLIFKELQTESLNLCDFFTSSPDKQLFLSREDQNGRKTFFPRPRAQLNQP